MKNEWKVKFVVPVNNVWDPVWTVIDWKVKNNGAKKKKKKRKQGIEINEL